MQLPSVVPYRAGEDFEKWTRGVERYLAAVNITKADRKCAILLHLVGPDIADLSETLTEDDPTGDSFERLKKKLTAYLSPVKNVVAERAAYHQMKMQADEEFEQFLGRLWHAGTALRLHGGGDGQGAQGPVRRRKQSRPEGETTAGGGHQGRRADARERPADGAGVPRHAPAERPGEGESAGGHRRQLRGDNRERCAAGPATADTARPVLPMRIETALEEGLPGPGTGARLCRPAIARG